MAFGSTFFPVVGRFSCKPRISGLMLNNPQCTQFPPGASGSSTISAKDCVPAGGSVHVSAGEIFLPIQVYFAGMDCPFANASLVSWRVMLASGVVDSDVAGLVMIGSGAVDDEDAQAESKD